MAQMDLTPLDDVLDKHFGKVGTPKRDAFESDVDEALHAYCLGEAMHVALEYLKLKPYALLSFDNSRVSVPKIII